MAILEALYQQDPFWIWLAVSSLFVALNLATGSSLLMWPGVAAALVATLEVAGVRLGLEAEGGLFVGLSAAMLAVVALRVPRPVVAAADPLRRSGAKPGKPGKVATGTVEQGESGRLIGRIGRASSEFNNGVGRVWIDGAEWAAELDGAEVLAEGEPVRITKVVGGIKLLVCSIHTD
jgi:membrane protein implicated in regulation of membrane protease activity